VNCISLSTVSYISYTFPVLGFCCAEAGEAVSRAVQYTQEVLKLAKATTYI